MTEITKPLASGHSPQRWLTQEDALADQHDMRDLHLPMSRFIMPGHPQYADAPIGCAIVWIRAPNKLGKQAHHR